MTSIASVGAVLACLNDQRPVQYTPALFDGTLYAVTQQRRERVDKIHVITTLSGRDKITSMLLDLQHGQFYAFCRDYHIDPASIKFDETMLKLRPNERMLDDIRTVDDNSYAADQICEIVRELTPDPDTRLHASAAGGRKTMSIYLTAAMQIFGRGQDRLSHVLVDEYFWMHTGFFYIPPNAARGRDHGPPGTGPTALDCTGHNSISRYSIHPPARCHVPIGCVTVAAAIAPWCSVPRRISASLRRSTPCGSMWAMKEKTVAVAGRRVKLKERELFIYALMEPSLRQQGRGDKGYVTLDEIEVKQTWRLFFSPNHGCQRTRAWAG